MRPWNKTGYMILKVQTLDRYRSRSARTKKAAYESVSNCVDPKWIRHCPIKLVIKTKSGDAVV